MDSSISQEAHLFLSLMLLFQLSGGVMEFTLEPPDPSYASNGSNAKLVWDYSVDNQADLQGIIYSVLLVPGGSFTSMLGLQNNGTVTNLSTIPDKYKGRVRIEGRASLVIESITSQDNTEFQCVLVANPGAGGDVRSKVQLIVTVVPQISIFSVSSSYNEGSAVSITCTASGTPDPDVQWIRNGIVKSSGKQTVSLTFSSVNRTDDGQYTCRANSSAGNDESHVTLVVHYTPEGTTLTTSVADNTVTQGGSVTLTCHVTAAKPQVSQYRFYLNDTTIVKDGNDNHYTIDNVQRSQHYGKYKCVPQNDVGNGSDATVTLDVNIPTQFTALPQNQTVNETNAILLSCDASGFPEPSFTWTKNGNLLSQSKQLSIQRSHRSNTGMYECTASNGVGQNKTAQAYVTVQYPPTIKKATTSTDKSWIGQTVTLTCESDGVPTPTLTWYKPNGNLINSITATKNIVDVKMNLNPDFGAYNCVAHNGLTPADPKTVEIKQIKEPGSPTIALDIQATSLTVKWTAPADGGSPITAYRVVILNGSTEIKNENITDPGTTSWTAGGLERETEYTVMVFARNAVFEGRAAEEALKTKYEGVPAAPTIDDLPSEVTDDTITLTWSEPQNNGKVITQYTVYQRMVTDRNKTGDWFKLKTITDISVRELKVELEKGKVYEFVVTATNELGDSLKEDEKIRRVIVKASDKPGGGGGTQTGGGDDGNGMGPAIYAGAAVAGVLLIIGIIVIIVLWRRRKQSSHEDSSRNELGSANPYEIEDGYQSVSREAAESLQASGPAGEPNYAQVDPSRKKKNRRPPSDEYAQVDKSKKTKKKKKPGELDYADLGDLRADIQLAPVPSGGAAAAAAPVVRPPAYEGTEYAEISQFGVPQPDPTYANVPKKEVVYSNVESM